MSAVLCWSCSSLVVLWCAAVGWPTRATRPDERGGDDRGGGAGDDREGGGPYSVAAVSGGGVGGARRVRVDASCSRRIWTTRRMGPPPGRCRRRTAGSRCCCATGRSCGRSGWSPTTSSTWTPLAEDEAQRYIEDVLVPDRAHRREPGGPGAGRAPIVVLDRGVRRHDHRAADHGVRHDHRRAHVLGHDHLGLRRRHRRGRRPRARLSGGVLGPARPPGRRHLHDHRHDRPRARVPRRRRPLAHPARPPGRGHQPSTVEERQAVITGT